MNVVTENFEKEMIAWRHDFHAHPELNFDLDITSAKVAEILKSFGLDVFEGIVKKVSLQSLEMAIAIRV